MRISDWSSDVCSSDLAGRAQVTEGALVSAAAGTLLTTIEQANPVYVNFSQSSSDLLATRRDIPAGKPNRSSLNRVPVKLELGDGPFTGISGLINFLDLGMEKKKGPAELWHEFPHPGRLLMLGKFVGVRIAAGP